MPPVLPEGEVAWMSAPKVYFSGDVLGWTFGGASFFDIDLSSAECELQVRQLVYAGGDLIVTSETSQEIISIRDEFWE
jgi:hypothetical protein